MPLKVELKPGEQLIIGDAVLVNGDQRARFTIRGDVPILREKDIMLAKAADTPAKCIYLAVELMYLARDREKTMAEYKIFREQLLTAAPSLWEVLDELDNEVLTGSLYKALKAAKRLVDSERELLLHAQRSAGVRPDSPEDGESA